MNYSIDQLVQEANKLPPIPQMVQKALALMRNPDANASGLAHVIGTDQVLGMDVIQELIMSCYFSNQLNRPLLGCDLQHGELWHHALGTAIGAKLISKQCRLNVDEEAYFAGLLCDIGKLIFEKLLREADLRQAESEQCFFLDLERANFGIDHAMLGAEIARRWQLPENLVESITYHHEPQDAKGHPLLIEVGHVADITMMILGIGIGIDGLRYSLNGEAMKRLGMAEEDLFHLVEDVAEQLAEVKKSYLIPVEIWAGMSLLEVEIKWM